MAPDLSKIRNFCIIAHVDHGKSTLADRLLQSTGTLTERDMNEQVLDTMDLEREKGVTIKASAVRMNYTANDGQTYEINLIDTPGHVDFGYEVSRALNACEGAMLVVDATQGIEAQTLANLYQALEADLDDHPRHQQDRPASARPDEVAEGCRRPAGRSTADDDPAHLGQGRHQHRRRCWSDRAAMCRRPTAMPDAPLRALIFDSHYDSYKGVIAYVRVIEGSINMHRRCCA